MESALQMLILGQTIPSLNGAFMFRSLYSDPIPSDYDLLIACLRRTTYLSRVAMQYLTRVAHISLRRGAQTLLLAL
jgi:hypothetical protein